MDVPTKCGQCGSRNIIASNMSIVARSAIREEYLPLLLCTSCHAECYNYRGEYDWISGPTPTPEDSEDD